MNWSWRELARQIGLVVREVRTVRAMNYLEHAGQKFCVDFGTDNAIDKAREHWRKKRRSK